MTDENVDLGYKRSPLRPRIRIKWPNGARVAVLLTPSVETWKILPNGPKYQGAPPGFVPETLPITTFTWREFGLRVGIWRMFELFKKYEIRPSMFINAAVGEDYPEVTEEAKKHHWEFIAHSIRQADVPANFIDDPKGERQLIRDTLVRFKKAFGFEAEGWASPGGCTHNTAKILTEEGISYFTDYYNDDQPYPLTFGKKTLMCIPHSWDMTDYAAFLRLAFTSEQYVQNAKNYFDVLYREGKDSGKIVDLSLHPHIIGQPQRIGAL